MFKITRIHVFLLLLVLLACLHTQQTVREYFENHTGDDNTILKTQIVPPVCPKCPDVINTCPKCEKAPPCPPCGRCPEPKFECKKVPIYDRHGDTSEPKYLPNLNPIRL